MREVNYWQPDKMIISFLLYVFLFFTMPIFFKFIFEASFTPWIIASLLEFVSGYAIFKNDIALTFHLVFNFTLALLWYLLNIGAMADDA
jgi:hypothetical protein